MLDAFVAPRQGVATSPVAAMGATTTEGKMKIEWVESDCTEAAFPGHSVWKVATLGASSLMVCKSRTGYDEPWIASVSLSGPYTDLSVHRATEAEAIADVLDLARRCGMVAE